MEQRHPRLLAVLDWPCFRLLGRCRAQGCGRLAALHTPRRWNRCLDTSLDVGITLRGWLLARGMDATVLDAWCEAYGLDPGAVVEPIQLDPASVA